MYTCITRKNAYVSHGQYCITSRVYIFCDTETEGECASSNGMLVYQLTVTRFAVNTHECVVSTRSSDNRSKLFLKRLYSHIYMRPEIYLCVFVFFFNDKLT